MAIKKICPKCNETSEIINSGWIIINKGKATEQKRKRYKCKKCGRHFSVNKMGKEVDKYYQVKAMQLYLEGLRIEMISTMIGVSHDVIEQWFKPIKKYLDSIRLTIPANSIQMSTRGRIAIIEKQEMFTSGVIVQGENSEVWSVTRGSIKQKFKKVEKIKYLKDDHLDEDETHYTSNFSSENDYDEDDDIEIDPNLSDDDIMRELGLK